MNKVLQATSRGQITIPKLWRGHMDSDVFHAEFDGKVIVLKPILQNKSFADTVEDAWEEYKDGEVVEGSELMKKYGL